MEPPKTAMKQKLEIDFEYNKARYSAISLIHELCEAGFIAPFCRNEASYHMTDLFIKHGIEVTTKEQREAAKCLSLQTLI